ncbi:SDR family oxidoreductase [Aquisalimonas sp.]|uniref:SDR family oxidoreductase n=1 Tax=Aquisalimonas sp. TaxID=1872621 RepID=UPI0025C40D5F|nr:SDR family oxidoreductase [Aquisalimonas sp.]
MALSLEGRRVLLTQADTFMGPALHEVFSELGAEVVADNQSLNAPETPAAIVGKAGPVDIMLAHLAVPAPQTSATDVEDAEFLDLFDHMVYPLPRLVRAVLPQMIERGAGKILVLGSAAALRGQKRTSSYSMARGAQLGYVQAVGVEVAKHNVQVNAIAQNFVDNPTYFPEDVKNNPKFQERLKREVPLGRLIAAREDAMFAASLCSDEIGCFVGQVFPVCGGWVTR